MYVSMKQACEQLKLSRWTVMRLIAQDELEAVKGPARNSHLRITKASVEGYIARRAVQAEG